MLMTLRARYFMVLLWVGLLPLTGRGQIEVGCKLSASTYLAFEEIPVTVEIVNQSSRPLVIGGRDAEAYLSFDIRNNRSEGIERRSGSNMSPITVPPRTTITHKLNLLQFYDMRKIGAYTLKARVEWKDRYYYSANCYFDVIRGDVLARIISEYEPSQTFRNYTLECINRDRMEIAFLRIDDDSACYGVIPLGKIIKLYKPVLIADADGVIHVLLHSGPAAFTEYVISADGNFLDQRVLETEDGMPAVTLDESGKVHVGQEFDEE